MRSVPAILACLAFAGCANPYGRNPALLATAAVVKPTESQTPGEYVLGCPDVVQVTVRNRPEWDALASVDVDGRLPLGPLGNAPAQGRTLADLRKIVADLGPVDEEDVTLELVETKASRITIFGPERNRQRVYYYKGPERVLDVLQRAGALQKGCADPRDIRIVRANVAVGTQPAVYKVDLPGIVYRGENETNLLLEPGDQIHVGELRRSSLMRLLPQWLKPIYARWTGLFG